MLSKTPIVLLLALSASAAFADTGEEYNYAPACTAPMPPSIGVPATEAELNAAHDAVTGFLTVSDSYQRCLGLALGKQQDTAFFMHSNVPTHIVKQIEGKVAANQKQKEDVAAVYNAAASGFKAKNGAP